MKLKLLSYNILNGFCFDAPPFIVNKTRMRAGTRILHHANADIIGLQEAALYPFAEQTTAYGSFFKKMYINTYIPPTYFRWAPVFLSRYRCTFRDRSVEECKCLELIVHVNKKKIILWDIPLQHDAPDRARIKAVHELLKAGMPDIILGDFNSSSPEDTYSKKRLLTGFSRFMKHGAREKVHELMQGAFVESLLDIGYKDTFLASENSWKHTMPTDLRSKHKDSGVRIDFILARNGLKVVDSGIATTRDTEIASDHYPVYAVVEI